MMISPSVGCSRPAIMRISVVLPQPEGPRMTINSPFFDTQVDAIHCFDVAEQFLQCIDFDESHDSS
jgi:hypothetical protein